MLSINATLEGDKVILTGLRDLADDMPKALKRALTRSVKGVHRAAFDQLSGPGGVYEERISKKTGNPWRKKTGTTASGGYPVPIRTGHLRKMLAWLKPGTSKEGLAAGPMEAIVYDSAEYANVIHDGIGSSAKFGARPFITDGFNRFNQGGKIAKIIEEEVEIEMKKKGLT